VIKKARLLAGSLSKVLVVCGILLAGCVPDWDAATNRFISHGTLALQVTENRDEISYWSGAGSAESNARRISTGVPTAALFKKLNRHFLGPREQSSGELPCHTFSESMEASARTPLSVHLSS